MALFLKSALLNFKFRSYKFGNGTKTVTSQQIGGARSSRSVHSNPRVETHLFSNSAKSLGIVDLHHKNRRYTGRFRNPPSGVFEFAIINLAKPRNFNFRSNLISKYTPPLYWHLEVLIVGVLGLADTICRFGVAILEHE